MTEKTKYPLISILFSYSLKAPNDHLFSLCVKFCCLALFISEFIMDKILPITDVWTKAIFTMVSAFIICIYMTLIVKCLTMP